MTAKETHAPSKPRIPTREEFHRFASNLLTEADFETHHSNGFQINRVAQALRWTKVRGMNSRKNDKNRK